MVYIKLAGTNYSNDPIKARVQDEVGLKLSERVVLFTGDRRLRMMDDSIHCTIKIGLNVQTAGKPRWRLSAPSAVKHTNAAS